METAPGPSWMFRAIPVRPEHFLRNSRGETNELRAALSNCRNPLVALGVLIRGDPSPSSRAP